MLFDREKGELWCFYTGDLTEKQLHRELKTRLARYMLPDRYLHLDALPHTASMKLNRAALTERMKQG